MRRLKKSLKRKYKLVPTQVELTGHDRWSGPEISIRKFPSRTKAKNYVDRVHSHNTAPTAPDFYYTARIIE